MEILDVSRGENIITQGQQGDYFYIIEKGAFTVLVNDKAVAQLGEGKSFGELALLYNSPRQATIRSESVATLFSLDRDTFRHILSHSSSNRLNEIKTALGKVPLLAGLTDEQFSKLTDTVEMVPYKAGKI
jgi:cAMP-dependent protein kinase regulator